MAVIEIGYNKSRCRDCKKEAFPNESGHYTSNDGGGCGAKWTAVEVLYHFPYEAGTKADIVERLIERWPVLECVGRDYITQGCMVSRGYKVPYGNWFIVRWVGRDGKFFERPETQTEEMSNVYRDDLHLPGHEEVQQDS
jgi:hypothetical protein